MTSCLNTDDIRGTIMRRISKTPRKRAISLIIPLLRIPSTQNFVYPITKEAACPVACGAEKLGDNVKKCRAVRFEGSLKLCSAIVG